MTMKKKFDYLVLGGGSAGCTLASRLSENTNINVALIEAGGGGRNFLSKCQLEMVSFLEIPNWTGDMTQSLKKPYLVGKYISLEVRD